MLKFHVFLLHCPGHESLLAGLFYLYGSLPPELLTQYIVITQEIELHLDSCLSLSAANRRIFDAHSQDLELERVRRLRDVISDNRAVQPDPFLAAQTYRMMAFKQTLFYQVMLEMHEHLAADVVDALAADGRALTPGLVGVVCGVALMVFIMLAGSRSTSTLYTYAISMEKRTRQLRVEKRKIDKILAEMLPKAVAYKSVLYQHSTLFCR